MEGRFGFDRVSRELGMNSTTLGLGCPGNQSSRCGTSFPTSVSVQLFLESGVLFGDTAGQVFLVFSHACHQGLVSI